MALIEAHNEYFVIRYITHVRLIGYDNWWEIKLQFIGGHSSLEFKNKEAAEMAFKNIKAALEKEKST